MSILFSLVVLVLVSSAIAEKISVDAHSPPQYHPEQLAVLDAIYKQTGGSYWVQDDNWENIIYCLRFGIVCDAARNVIQINLSSNNLTGVLPNFKDLSFLQSIDVSNNFITGDVVGLERITSLTSVNLQNNVLQGPIPLLPSSLTVLNLQQNFLAGDINNFLPKITNIAQLYLQGTMVFGNLSTITFPKSLSTCSLQSLPFSCPVPSQYSSTCGATCSNCATTWNSCDYCLDTTCGWCQLDSTKIGSGICMEISKVTSGQYVCGISGLLETTCSPTCTGSSCSAGGASCIPNVGVMVKEPLPNCVSGECVYESQIFCKGSSCSSYCPQFNGYCCPSSNPVCTDGGQCCCSSGHAGGCANHDGDCLYN